jgi:hypothetical protein
MSQRSRIEVRRTVHRFDGEWVYGSPKSPRSTRDVPIPETLLARLCQYVAAHPYRNDSEAQLWPGVARYPKRLSFDEQLDMHSLYMRRFRPATIKLGMHGVGWRSLRHT